MVMLIVNGMRLWWCWISICRYITVFWVGWLGGPEGSRVLFRGKIPPDHWVSGVVMREVAVLAVKAVTCCKADSSNNACPEVAWIPRALYATLDKPYWGDSAHIRMCGESDTVDVRRTHGDGRNEVMPNGYFWPTTDDSNNDATATTLNDGIGYRLSALKLMGLGGNSAVWLNRMSHRKRNKVIAVSGGLVSSCVQNNWI